VGDGLAGAAVLFAMLSPQWSWNGLVGVANLTMRLAIVEVNVKGLADA
jgi:hypothetical protein